MSNSYKSDKDSRAPSRFLTPQEEYERGLRRRPKGTHFFDDDEDDDELVDTDNTVVPDEEE